MSFAFVVIAVALGFAGFRLGQDYLRRSMRSYEKAAEIWSDMIFAAKGLIEKETPEGVSKAVIALTRLAGCGCFVRGVLLQHYFPQLVPKPGEYRSMGKAFADIDKLGGEQRERFNHFLTLVIVYDSFRNPLQGWLFRRIMRTYAGPQRGFREKREAEIAAFSLLTRRVPVPVPA